MFHRHRHPPCSPDCRPRPSPKAHGTYGHCWRYRCTSNLGAPSCSRSPCRWCSPFRGSHQGFQIRTRLGIILGFDAARRCLQVCSSGLMPRRLKFRNSAHHRDPSTEVCTLHSHLEPNVQRTPSLPSAQCPGVPGPSAQTMSVAAWPSSEYQLALVGTGHPNDELDYHITFFVRCRSFQILLASARFFLWLPI